MRVSLFAAIVAAAALATISCGGITDPSQNTTETFNGTLPKGGQSQIFTFSAGSTGEYTVKTTSMTPTYNSFFGTWIGQGDGCGSLYQQNTLSIVGSQAVNGQILKGNYCVFLYDIGNLTTNETFTLTVSHP
jgi:hypothetical protein